MNIKVYALLTKLSHLSDEAFHAHWRHPHGTLTRKLSQISRYVQNHALGAGVLPGLAPPGFQGVPAIWVPELATLGELFKDPNYAALAADAKLLYDETALVWLITSEHVVKRSSGEDGAGSKPVKAMAFLKRKASCEALAFRDALMSLAAELSAEETAVHSCVVSIPVESAYPPPESPAYDAVLEIGFADRAQLERAWPPICRQLTAAPRSAAVDLQASRGFLAEEERVIWPA